ncbi:MAG: hypothetical protein IJU76_04540 [Desulfovibrionaceae bacterium]|nr:hypothetical protein [Desulfovibrionaceae bacterium]
MEKDEKPVERPMPGGLQLPSEQRPPSSDVPRDPSMIFEGVEKKANRQ